jgi:hypothetical protein
MLECFVPDQQGVVWGAADVKLFDDAVDYAARVSCGTVCEFLAAPSVVAGVDGRRIDVAVEFFVPPCSLECFADELDRALIRRSLEYGAARRNRWAAPVCVMPLSPSLFHQWRLAWKVAQKSQHARRWSTDREMLDQVLQYAATGWRDDCQGA